MDRDPRQAPWGLFSGGSFTLDSARVFTWFETPADLADFLVEGLPETYRFDTDDLLSYQAEVTPLAKRIEVEGMTRELLEALNDAMKKAINVEWWGSFDELLANQSEFARQITRDFLDQSDADRPIDGDESDDFVDYLKTCGNTDLTPSP